MGAFYTAGETKTRPGLYNRYTTKNTCPAAGAAFGVCAVPVKASWGPIGKVTAHESAASVLETYGAGGTVDAATQLFSGGASKVFVYRMGSIEDGKASVQIETGSAEAEKITVTAKYPGTFPLSITLRNKAADSAKKEFLVYSGASVLETFTIPAASGSVTDECQALIGAVKASKYVDVTGAAALNAPIANFTQTALTGGTNPTVTNGDYSAAFNALEPYEFNVITAGTVDSAVVAVLEEYVRRVCQTGKLCFAVAGFDTVSTSFDDRMAASKAANDEKVIMVGDGYTDQSGNAVDGYLAASMYAGLIVATPSNESVSRKVIPGAVEPLTKLTNAQYEDAIRAGLVMLSTSPDGQVWFDSGITTLVAPAANQDAGWKKIRHVATRFEMMNRLDKSLSPLVGRVNCDSDGVGRCIKVGLDVLSAMVAEGKLLSTPAPVFMADPSKPFAGDSAWFIVQAYDTDSLEKIYLLYEFSYSAANA